MDIKTAVKWAKFEISQLQWVIDILPKDKLKGEAKKRLLEDYERGEKRIEAQQTLIDSTKKIDEGKIDQLEIAGKFCLLQPCEIREDEATGRCYACKIGSSIKNAFSQSHS